MVAKQFFLSEQVKRLLLAEYDSKPETVARLSRTLGIPAWRISRWAKELGVSKPRRSKANDAFIESFYCHLSLDDIAQKQNRTRDAVRRNAYRLGINKLSDGYTIGSFSVAMGYHHRTIETWIERGWLKASKRNVRADRDYWYISDAAIYEFIKQHEKDIDLTRADPLWLRDVLAGPYGLGVLVQPQK